MQQKVLIVPNLRQGELWRSHGGGEDVRVMSYENWVVECFERFGWREDIQLIHKDAFEFLWASVCTTLARRHSLDATKLTKELFVAIESLALWGDPHDVEQMDPLVAEAMALVAQRTAQGFAPFYYAYRWVADNALLLSRHYCIGTFGYDQCPSRLQLTCQAFSKLDAWFDSQLPERPGASTSFQLFDDSESELKALAHWVKDSVSSGRQCTAVIPRLGDKKTAIDRILTEIVWPDAVNTGKQVCELPVDFGTVTFLNDTGIGSAIALLLEQAFEPLTLTQWQSIVLSPFIAGWSEEVSIRRRVASQLDRWPRRAISTNQFIALCKREGCDAFIEAVQGFMSFSDESKLALEWSQWLADKLDALLDHTANLALHDATSLMQIDELRRVITSVGVFGRTISATEFWQFVKRMLGRKVLRKTVQDVKLRLIDCNDIVNLPLNGAWVAECDPGQWARHYDRPALIPVDLLVAWGHPSVQDGQLRTFGNAELISLAKLGNHLSCAKHYNHKRSNPMSELHSCELQNAQAATGGLGEVTLTRRAFEVLPWVSDSKVLRQGQAWIDSHNSCPMKGFLRHRLGLQARRKKHIGLEPRLFSLWVHKCLELAWLELNTSAKLHEEKDQLQEHIARWAREGRDALLKREILPDLEGLLAHVEALIRQVLHAHFNYQLKRSESFEVVATEQTIEVEAGPYRVVGIIDRVDQIEGARVPIDYKRYAFQLRDWTGEDLRSLQLLIYIQDESLEAAGAGVEQVLSNQYKVSGLADEIDVSGFGKFRDERTFADLKEAAKIRIDQIATEIKDGVFAPAPLNASIDCKGCSLRGCCHVEAQ
ncbi:MAG: hypothetical protein C9356_11695 [Oleiphilus sp.]|nr:MAG: hypothetical protein C9356_11695 [Oleiphilus sp.]